MSFVAAATGAALVSRPVQTLTVIKRVSHTALTAVGAGAVLGIGLVAAPHVGNRAPMPTEKLAQVWLETKELAGGEEPDSDPREAWRLLTLCSKPSFKDLQRPWVFTVFELAGRTAFSMYADAAGLMTPAEFRCALHKLVDVTLSAYAPNTEGVAEAQAAAVRELVGLISDTAFRVIDEDGDGVIDAAEFLGALILVLATICGEPAAAPMLRRVAFRIVDADGSGAVSEKELLRWVELALKHGTAPAGAQLEPRWCSWLFGSRKLTPAQLTRKWLRAADADGDGQLSPAEFEAVRPLLRVHEVVRLVTRNFADRRLSGIVE